MSVDKKLLEMFKEIADILGLSLLTHHAPTRRMFKCWGFWMGSFQVEQDGPFLSFLLQGSYYWFYQSSNPSLELT